MKHSNRHATLAAGVALAAALSGAAWAETTSSFADSRGYQNCVDGAGKEEKLVKVDARYFIYDHSDARRFYINGYAFRNGDSVPVKIACDTTPSGNRLLNVTVDAGTYAGRVAEPVNVAGN